MTALLVEQGYDMEEFARYGGGPDAPATACYQIDGVWHARDEATGEIIATGSTMKSVLPHADIVEIEAGAEGVDAVLAAYLDSITPPSES